VLQPRPTGRDNRAAITKPLNHFFAVHIVDIFFPRRHPLKLAFGSQAVN
jgi:hypothetical protein